MHLDFLRMMQIPIKAGFKAGTSLTFAAEGNELSEGVCQVHRCCTAAAPLLRRCCTAVAPTVTPTVCGKAQLS